MTTSNKTRSAEALLKIARALKAEVVYQGLVWWASLSAASLLVAVLLDNVLHLPQALRLPLDCLFCGFVLLGLYRSVLRPFFQPLSPSRAARALEIKQGIAGNVLINAYHFEKGDLDPARRKFVDAILNSSQLTLEAVRPQSLWLTPKLKKWLGILLVVLTLWAGLSVAFPHYVSTSMSRIFLPLSDIPPLGAWQLIVQPSGVIRVTEGDDLKISVQVRSTFGAEIKPPVPVIIWKEGVTTLESHQSAGDRMTMLPGDSDHSFSFSFSPVNGAFCFRVWADDSCSPATVVQVTPLPRLKSSKFDVTPPPYTGLLTYAQPGPPLPLNVPVGSTVVASFDLRPVPQAILWRTGKISRSISHHESLWQNTVIIDEPQNYEILSVAEAGQAGHAMGQGQITPVADRPPEIDFVTEERNRLINPGGKIPVEIKATDDYGVASISLLLARSDDPTTTQRLKTWNLMGPPGQKEPANQSYEVELDPTTFIPGSVFLLTAEATDFCPQPHHTLSRPILLRVSGLKDLTVPTGDPLEALLNLIKDLIARQTRANGLTDNLALHLSEALAAHDLNQHQRVMFESQHQAQELGRGALTEAAKHDEAKPFTIHLESLVNGEMGLALGQIGQVGPSAPAKLPALLEGLQKRQTYILSELIALLGQIATSRQEATAGSAAKANLTAPPIPVEQAMAELKDDLKAFVDDQKKVVEATKSLKDLHPDDLTTDKDSVLGDLARTEADKAKFFQEKLTDFSKLPLQDFADGKVVSEMNSVFQEVKTAADSLYQKNSEIAVAAELKSEQAAQKLEQELEQNLERWLPNSADHTKWSMEETPTQGDTPLAELPKGLEDIVGDLLDKEENMTDEVDDVSSSAMTSVDKGAGWGAGDGPISNMSAKGVTGNQLPNNNEISGRSGEGREGKSNGQMVGDVAEGKEGRTTPTRLSPSPFESGSVDDKSKGTKGGATGGGKLSGTGEEGLRGPLPPPVQQKLKRLAEQQIKLRQQAESLAVELRKQRKPTGDLESAVTAMKQFEEAAKTQNGIALYQGYHQAMDALAAARTAYRGGRVNRVEIDTMTNRPNKDISDAQAENVPPGYEEMAGAYFRSLNETSANK